MEALEKLKQRLAKTMTGMVSAPGESAYGQAISIWPKPMVLPRLVAHCADSKDVQLALSGAQDVGIPLSVRGGGHDWTGRALCDGLTLDITRMCGVGAISTDATIEVEGGVKGTHVYRVTDFAGMAPVLGAVADIGVAGIVTGGGYGPLLRQFGLACDNLLAATVILADGRVVRASKDSEDELFWAIRGGGGNFGVVTSMQLALKPLVSVRSGLMLFPLDSGETILPRLHEIWQDSPLELDVHIGTVPGPDGSALLYISPTWSGDPKAADAALAPLFEFKNRIMADVSDQPYGVSRTIYDRHIVKGRIISADTLWLREWNENISHIILDAVRRRPSPLCFVLCHQFSGAATMVPESHTAFGIRKSHIWFEVIAPLDAASGRDGSAEANWCHEVIDSLSPYSFPGAYPNMLGPCATDRIQQSFGGNAPRLLAAKKRYDPTNLFRSTISLPYSAEL